MSTTPEVKIIDYTGDYPNLCSGTLIIEVDNKRYEIKRALSSGGCVWFDDDMQEHVESGPWYLDPDALPEEIRYLHDELQYWVNETIPFGCCGGCV